MLHFDSATRGADGALGLIWRQGFRQPLTALGCIIMVLVVTVDPFVQQLVRPVDCSVELSGGNGAATLPRTNVFILQYYGDPSSNLDFFSRISGEVENVLHEAMYTPGRNPPWHCSTGNCTFPETYGTIGICYSCQDTSTNVTLNATCLDLNSSHQSPILLEDCPENLGLTVATEFTYGNDFALGTKCGIYDENVLAEALFHRYGIPSEALYFGFLLGATADTGGRIDWTTSDIDNSTCNSKEPARPWTCQGYGAATCSLHPCVQTYKAAVIAGNLTEHLIESSLDTPWGIIRDKDGYELYLALIDTHCSKIQTPTNLEWNRIVHRTSV